MIDLDPEEEDRLQDEATRHGLDPAEYSRRLIQNGLSTPLSDKQRAAISLLQSWIDEDATNDPEAIRAAEEELKAFKQAMNENRAAERPLYP